MIADVAGLGFLDERGIAAVKIFAEALGVDHGPFLLVFHVVSPFRIYTVFLIILPLPKFVKDLRYMSGYGKIEKTTV